MMRDAAAAPQEDKPVTNRELEHNISYLEWSRWVRQPGGRQTGRVFFKR